MDWTAPLNQWTTILAIIAAIVLGLTATNWALRHGLVRGLGATVCRGLWLLPILLAFLPEERLIELPRTLSLLPVHVLIDDSESMKKTERFAQAIDKRDEIASECRRLGCEVKTSLLSELHRSVDKGYTPLADSISPWLREIGQDPWLVISDGGDWRPTARLAKRRFPGPAKNTKSSASGAEGGAPAARGLVLGFPESPHENVWIERIDIPQVSFESKPIFATVWLGRSQPEGAGSDGISRVQVQVRIPGGEPLASANAEFRGDTTEAAVEIPIPPLARGDHQIAFHALPSAGETILWDNRSNRTIEVHPDTVGVLHLLGSPSWDGRFFRRFLKAEPKYDLISFFILRDPWDSQHVNERELSLIPFPVERLFTEELPNFRVIILQNFTLLQFLQPQYQKNLVEFVKNGGGLFFLGGERALRESDLSNSPIREILPFDVDAAVGLGGGKTSKKITPWYDKDLAFDLELAKPDPHRRSLASVYDDWESLGVSLAAIKGMRGAHHTENVSFLDDRYTPLLNGRTKAGESFPLAVASYPGKGRAIWMFSDSFYRFNFATSQDIPRQTYGKFMEAAMTWLLRRNLSKPMIADNLRFDGQNWRVDLRGPAVRYFASDRDSPKAQGKKQWRVSLCGISMDPADAAVDRTGPQEVTLSGRLSQETAGLESCRFEIHGAHPAFGSLSATHLGSIPRKFHDSEIGESSHWLKGFATRLGAQFGTIGDSIGGNIGDSSGNAVGQWLPAAADQLGTPVPPRYKKIQDPFWVFRAWYIWALLAFIPLEVLLRRWPEIFSARSA